MGSLRDSSDHRIAKFSWTPPLLTGCHEICRLLCCGTIKMSNALLDQVVEKVLERGHEGGSPLASCHYLQTEPDLKHRDGSRPHGMARLAIQPLYDFDIRSLMHECRQDIGIEKNHGLKVAG
jgi:hypothetical protein